MRYLVKKSTICGLQSPATKYRSSCPSSIKGQNYGSLPRSWLQYHLLKIVRDRLHFISYRRIKEKQAMSCKDQTKGKTTESLEQFRVYDDFKSGDYERKLKVCEVCSCNSHSQSKLCVVFRLSFFLKRLRFLTPAWLRENTAIFTTNTRKSRELIYTCSRKVSCHSAIKQFF